MSEWQRVVFVAECFNDGDDAICPFCLVDYGDCPCPGPSQEDEYEYQRRGGVLMARRRTDTPGPDRTAGPGAAS